MTRADTVLLNGRIFCGLVEGFVEAFAVADGALAMVDARFAATAP